MKGNRENSKHSKIRKDVKKAQSQLTVKATLVLITEFPSSPERVDNLIPYNDINGCLLPCVNVIEPVDLLLDIARAHICA